MRRNCGWRSRDLRAAERLRAWADATPIQNRLIDALTGVRLHIIATPRKVGTAPIQREGVEYEFDIFGELDQENTLVIHKSRCPALTGAVIARPTAGLAATLQAWLAGAPPPPSQPITVHASVEPVAEQAMDRPARHDTAARHCGTTLRSNGRQVPKPSRPMLRHVKSRGRRA